MFALKLFSEAGPDPSLAWLLWVVLAIFFAIVLIGWAVSRKQEK